MTRFRNRFQGVGALLGVTFAANVGTVGAQERRDIDTLTTIRQGDERALLIRRNTEIRVVWETDDANGFEVRWVSEPYGEIIPDLTFVTFSADSTPDLWLPYWMEEMVGASMIVASGGARPMEAFRSRGTGCSWPELSDVDGDGRVEILDHVEGAMYERVCETLAGEMCAERFPVDWIDVWAWSPLGLTQDTDGIRNYYADLSRAYRDGAEGLAEALANNERIPGCDAETVVGMRALADRASEMSRR